MTQRSEDTAWCIETDPVTGRQCMRERGHSGLHVTDGVPQAEFGEVTVPPSAVSTQDVQAAIKALDAAGYPKSTDGRYYAPPTFDAFTRIQRVMTTAHTAAMLDGLKEDDAEMARRVGEASEKETLAVMHELRDLLIPVHEKYGDLGLLMLANAAVKLVEGVERKRPATQNAELEAERAELMESFGLCGLAISTACAEMGVCAVHRMG